MWVTFQLQASAVRVIIALAFFGFGVRCAKLSAQNNLRFVHYTTQDGLPDGTIGCITQDSYGFMWFGTDDGLCRFDGNEFLIFRRGEKNKSICGNNISALKEDTQKKLWIGTSDGGVCFLDLLTNQFHWLDDPTTGFISKSVTSIDYSEKKGLVYVCWNNGGLFSIDIHSLNCQKINVYTDELPMTYYDVMCSRAGPIYCSPVGRRYVVLPDSYSSKKDVISFYPNPAHTISSFEESSNGNIWCGAWDPNLHVIEPTTGNLRSYPLTFDNKKSVANNEIFSISIDRFEKIWCGTKDGLFIFNPQSETFQVFQHKNKDPQSIIANKVQCIFKDNRNRMWLGTNSGLSIYDPHSSQFQVEWISEDENCGVNDFLQVGESFLVATACGLFVKNKNSNSFEEIESRHNGEQLQITKLFMDGRRRIYVGSNKSMFMLDTSALSLKPIDGILPLGYLDFYNITSSQINAIIEHPFRGSITTWVSIFGHLISIHETGSLRAGAFVLGNAEKFENLVNKFFVDTEKNLWILGRSHGLMLYVDQPELLKIEELNNSIQSDFTNENINLGCRFISEEAGMPFIEVTDMTQYGDSYFIATNGYGLYRMRLENGVFRFEHIADSPNVIKGIIKDDNEQIWLVNNSSLFHFKPDENRFMPFNASNGIPASGIRGHSYLSQNGNIYLGGMGHLVSFNPEMLIQNEEIPTVRFVHFEVANQSMDHLLFSDMITLSFNQNYIAISCAALCFTAPEKNLFAYRLLGLDQEWRLNGSNERISFNSLPPGDYELQVKASNSDGIWNDNPSSIKFKILPPFYLRWWFFVIATGLVFCAIYLLYNYRIKQILAMQNLRNKIARDLHDEVGSTLGSISIYSEAARQQLEESHQDQAQDIIRRIGENSREMIEKMSDIVWSVNPGNDSVEHLISRMESFASGILGTSQIDFKVVCSPTLFGKNLTLDERKNLFLIFKEAVYNSLKYSECDFIEIDLSETSGSIKLLIADNGHGFDNLHLKTHNGNGLRNMKSRAEELGGSLEVKSNSSGTEISLSFKKQ